MDRVKIGSNKRDDHPLFLKIPTDPGGFLPGDAAGEVGDIVIGLIADHLHTIDSQSLKPLQNGLGALYAQIVGADANFQMFPSLSVNINNFLWTIKLYPVKLVNTMLFPTLLIRKTDILHKAGFLTCQKAGLELYFGKGRCSPGSGEALMKSCGADCQRFAVQPQTICFESIKNIGRNKQLWRRSGALPKRVGFVQRFPSSVLPGSISCFSFCLPRKTVGEHPKFFLNTREKYSGSS